MKLPRIMLAAPKSGSGKTLITCGILQALIDRGKRAAAFKCGPDYIDPMFHGKVLGIPSKNLDTFFTDEETTRYLFGKGAGKADISVMEGVMGYYDGIAGISTRASAYDLARITKTPVILVVDTKGMSLSVAALIRGFLQFKPDSNIKGIILNRMLPSLYPGIKEQIESALPVKVLGYVPKAEEYEIKSRHLGLVTPDEIEGLKEKLSGLAGLLKETLDLNLLLKLAEEAPELTWKAPLIPRLPERERVKIGIARDEAFCFHYQDNLELMEDMGAELTFFSPLKDSRLPGKLAGLIFYGGYPELYGERLSRNLTMMEDIREAIEKGIPYLAECGGFMYLHTVMEGMDKRDYPMAGVIAGKAYRTDRLSRFGYIELKAKKSQILGEKGISFKAHEFHYYDSTENGGDFHAEKPLGKREWDCIHADDRRAVGFPHLYYYSNPRGIYHFLEACRKRGTKDVTGNHKNNSAT